MVPSLRPSRFAPTAAALAACLALAGAAAGVAPADASAGTSSGPEGQAARSDRALDGRTRTALSRALRRTLADTTAPGVIAGVWVGDRGWTGTAGVTRRGGRARPALATHTRIASITKTFTGTLILQLVDEGRLRLDDTIERWFPALPDAGRITIRQLGDMGSGIDTYTTDGATVDRYLARPQTVWSPQELIAIGTGLPRVFAPGAGFRYSNTNTLMLGRIAEQVTGRPLARLMRERLFRPLGMRKTTYPATNALPSPSWRGITDQGAAPGMVRDATSWSPTFAGAAGQIISTLGDMRRWTRALGTGSLLRPATQRERLLPNAASVAGQRAYLFALGRDTGWLTHSGELPGFNSQVAYLPARRISIVVFTNADIASAGGAPAAQLWRALARVVAPEAVPGG